MIARILLCLVAGITYAAAQKTLEFEVSPSNVWLDTGLELKAGDMVKITANGTLQYTGAKPCGPEGLPRGWMDMIRQLPLNDSGRGALLGRISDSPAARPFLVGTGTERRAGVPGRLFLGLNQMSNDRPTGSYKVTVEHTTTAAASQPKNVRLPVFTQKMLDSIPARVQDAQGTPGDRVNFVIVGSQHSVETAFRNAGWVTVDRTNKDAIFRGILVSVSKQAYVTLPMSELLLFDRVQDYGYAQGDPVRVVAARHHFRLWKAPFTADGQTVWAGAGTHDIGFDRDKRNGKITHKIESNTDGEREYIGQSLMQTGTVAKIDYMRPKVTVEKANTAHGQEFTSDGRTMIVYLQPDDNANAEFADMFCSVLQQQNPDEGEWGGCEQYIEGGGKTTAQLGALPADYRVLIVPGFLSSCVSSDAPAFMEGQTALRDRHKFGVDMITVPNDPSELNAKKIAEYVREQSKNDRRKFILVGYSKGAPDILVALAEEEGLRDKVAAFVSVAGAVGGSPIADALPGQADRWIRQFNMKGCEGDIAAGFKSLQRAARQAFLAKYPHPVVPSYSIVAKSDKSNTSKALAQTWQLLTAWGPVQDGQLVKDDAIIPESTYLGVAIADHFAIALPFDKSKDSAIRSGMDKTKYPRGALLESIIRFVTADLAKKK